MTRRFVEGVIPKSQFLRWYNFEKKDCVEPLFPKTAVLLIPKGLGGSPNREDTHYHFPKPLVFVGCFFSLDGRASFNKAKPSEPTDRSKHNSIFGSIASLDKEGRIPVSLKSSKPTTTKLLLSDTLPANDTISVNAQLNWHSAATK